MTRRNRFNTILGLVAMLLIGYLLWVNHVRHGSSERMWILIIAEATAAVWTISTWLGHRRSPGELNKNTSK